MFRFLTDPDLRSSARRARWRLSGAAVAAACRGVLAAFVPFWLGKGIDAVRSGLPDTESEVLRIVGIMAAFALAVAVGQFYMRWWWIGWSRSAEQRTRNGLFGHLLRLDPGFFARSRTGDLMSRLTSDVEAVRMGYGPGLMHIYQTGLMTIGALVLMTTTSPFLTILAIAPMALMALGMRFLMPRIHADSLAVQERQAELSSRAQDTFSGARVVKAFARERFEEHRFRELSVAMRRDSVRLARTRALFNCLIEAFAVGVTVIVLLVGGSRVIAGDITVGQYVAFNGYMNMLIWPMIALGWTLSLFQRAEASEGRLDEVRREVPRILDGSLPASGPVPSGHVSCRGLTYAYPDGSEPALVDIRFDLPAGGTLGVMGGTASGKSTLSRLLPRLLDPPPGSLFLDDADVRDWNLRRLRRSIALVPQEPFLFSDTIARNIAFGAGEATPEAIREAARLACLDDDVSTFPDGYDTVVGERGVVLSGGQKQRTALARAFLVDAPVLLLDDALSAVDTETEHRILQALRDHTRNRTAIIVSHRVSAVRHADRILVLEAGRIVEQGTHAELVSREGRYAETARLQAEAEELENL